MAYRKHISNELHAAVREERKEQERRPLSDKSMSAINRACTVWLEKRGIKRTDWGGRPEKG